ncbi:MAG TPA: triose-phosphate isomerase [Candidatus Hydrogenedentes bacterium]|nr:triose-phosphate isomerase [Candidatus Hydrogenedentota bacterium]
MRTPIVAGNWKMNQLSTDAVALATALKNQLADVEGTEVVVCPVATVLKSVADALDGSRIQVSGQNCWHAESGAFTGELSPQMLQDAGCTWTILGHSERRHIFRESDALLNEKLKFALASGLNVIFCIGETLEEREGGTMNDVLTRQLLGGLSGFSDDDFSNVVLAYEPVWAIGTGLTATPAQAEEAHAFVRDVVKEKFNGTVADALRIQYGGSVKPDNAAELMSQQNVDGALVGGASLDAESFAAIVRATI